MIELTIFRTAAILIYHGYISKFLTKAKYLLIGQKGGISKLNIYQRAFGQVKPVQRKNK